MNDDICQMCLAKREGAEDPEDDGKKDEASLDCNLDICQMLLCLAFDVVAAAAAATFVIATRRQQPFVVFALKWEGER